MPPKRQPSTQRRRPAKPRARGRPPAAKPHEPSAKPTPDAPPEWVGSREALAKEIGCHPNSIPRWLKQFAADPDAPRLKRANGDYHVPTWRAVLEKYAVNIAAAAEQDAGEMSMSEIKRLQEIEKLDALRRARARDEGCTYDAGAVSTWIASKADHIKQVLTQRLRNELPPKLAGLTAAEIGHRLDSVINEVIQAMRAPLR